MAVPTFLNFLIVFVLAHEGHSHAQMPSLSLEQLGRLHLTFLHFPIALIIMAALAEIFYLIRPKALFDNAARFMLLSAAILSIPTAVLGLIYSYSADYDSLLAYYLDWHMWLGFATASLAIILAAIREYFWKNLVYYSLLVLLVILLIVTAVLGGRITFGPTTLFPFI